DLKIKNAIWKGKFLSLVSGALFASVIFPGTGPKLTTTTDVQNHIVFLGIKPLDNLRGQLGDEGGGGLICLRVS
ncbi:hypothetical protein OFB78_28445, partial [Escherichia coli]|nr:hypothetical protein [Escherichia coli]